MGALTLLLPLPALVGWDYPLLLPYAWHKALHIVGAILFLGNVAAGALYGAVAVASRDPAKVRFTLSVINWSDATFTGPGVLLLMSNGLAMAGALGGVAANRFTLWGLAGLWLVVAVWLLSVVPDQHRILGRADEAASPTPAFRAAVVRWNVVGSLAGALGFLVLFWMVLKP